jgi:23S rRNA (uracil1939-C5)-methyltransferase
VKETLHKIGHCDAPVNDCLMDLPPYHYRNKVQVPFGMNKGRLVSGFYKARTNEIIDHDFCMIQNEFSNTVTKRVKELFERYSITPYDKEKKQGMIKHVLTRYGTHTDEGMLVFITYTKKIPHLKNIVRILVEEFPQIKTVIQNINTRHDNVILGDQEIILYGDGVIHDTLLGNTYTISLKSFYQINPRQVEVLYAKAIAYAHFQKEDIVIDAYCGIGTIALSLASQVKEVYGVEVVPQAIEDAKKNALANGITNAYFTCDDAGDYMVKCAKEGKHIDVVMVDPPRKGCSELFLSQLVTLSPNRIVYISCNVSTQARDIDILQQHGYQVEEVTPVDMFPQTNHVETVVLLTRQNT